MANKYYDSIQILRNVIGDEHENPEAQALVNVLTVAYNDLNGEAADLIVDAIASGLGLAVYDFSE